ncbi:hypothetical protein RO3G_13079 [Rhizopus delemar RA 99-880]|uniref:Uncharacterized protein n=1 Tax=Rhizopus delemar (strain RA 99-880 / ATCC MYA-4621 / FGSC 9543 / NRRL 43880) TaxID=246409 RepID=I1CIT8_RHIO9|nr:hypothetical protein RO3G_13079 [Rhizopus delemar RA 99-880]|eukprot:EIE88368.1 hypothetical protein RO3G_13079 [Rhizopus delemar RA 99-880]
MWCLGRDILFANRYHGLGLLADVLRVGETERMDRAEGYD